MKKLKSLGTILGKLEQKKIIGGYDGSGVVLCGGPGDYPERCSCGGGAFYCCHNTRSTCLTNNGCNSKWGACTKA